MKKLKLKALELGAKELLTKEQMKKVAGGTGCPSNLCTVGSGYGSGYCGLNGLGFCNCIVNSQYYYTAFCASE